MELREDAIEPLARVLGRDDVLLDLVFRGYQSFDCTWPLERTRMSMMARS